MTRSVSEPVDDRDLPEPTTGTALLSTGVRMHYYVDGPTDGRPLVLLHGWPNTGWQFRRVLPLFAQAGYRVVAPDYRGAGHTSRPSASPGIPLDPRPRDDLPAAGYDKWSMAEDVHELLHDHLGLPAPVVVLGHDIGSMIATAYALRYRTDTRALVFGEAPQPGTSLFDQAMSDPQMFHFSLHAQLDLPETLVTGHEREYLQHFYDKLGYAPHLVDTDHYVAAYRQPGALRAGFDLYRAFEQDAADIRSAIADGGKLSIPVLATVGAFGHFGRDVDGIEAMGREFAEHVRTAAIGEAGHWLAEENPRALVDVVTRFDT